MLSVTPRAWTAIVWLGASALLPVSPAARAQEQQASAPERPAPGESPTLSEELRALASARLLSLEAASADQLRALVARAERLAFDGRSDAAVVVLLEALESPRFADFEDFPEYAAAEHMAAGALIDLGSLRSARRYLQHAVARGPKSAYYGPAVRKLVDVALALGDLEPAAKWLATHEPSMPEDAKHELAYLRARAALDAGEAGSALPLLTRIGKRSRFYGNAQYLLGVIAARDRRYSAAEQRFCAVAGTGVTNKYSFYVDQRFFEVQDLARLGLGRTAHEMRRGDDAFYYYFQVPRDSPRLSEALFEAAYATYEAEEHDTAVDLLDQLQAHAPSSPFVDEAAILRGYVALARCDFEQADGNFERFITRYTPLVAHVDRLLESRVRRELLYEELLRGKDERTRAQSPLEKLLLELLRVDPEFYRLHEQVRALDAEAARAGRAALAMDVLLARFEGSDRPRALPAEDAYDAELDTLERDLGLAALGARAIGDELDALRAARVPGKQLAAHERALSALAEKLYALERKAGVLRAFGQGQRHAHAGAAASSGKPVTALLARDVQSTARLPARVAEVRAKLVRAASERAELALRELRERVFGLLRRARIGRIDAVMGSKRRIEVQIESLAAGRFPAELRDPLRVQGLLADDEEYWPFEGEDWPDEYEERYGAGEGDAAPEAPPGKRGAAR